MEDMTLSSELYNNVKFNMQKLILDIPEGDSKRLGEVFGASEEETAEIIIGCGDTAVELAKGFLAKHAKPEVRCRKTVAFIGDSITSDRESYLRAIQYLFRDDEEINIIDAAVSGDKSDDAKMKFHLRVLNYKPDVTHILIGTNDLRINEGAGASSCISLGEYEKNLDYMISTLKSAGSEVVLSTISPIVNSRLKARFPDDHWYYRTEDIAAANDIIAALAGRYGCGFNDMRQVYRKYPDEELMLADGLHLNKKGQALLLEGVLTAMENYL